MADSLTESLRNYERRKEDYDKLVDQMNEIMREIDNAYTEDEKKKAKKKRDVIKTKLEAADKREKEAKRKMDEAFRNNR